MNDDLTTLVCLFHHPALAQAATANLTRAGIPASSISLIHDGSGSSEFSSTTLDSLGVPARDLDHLREGVSAGGVVVAVKTTSEHERDVEAVFEQNHSKVIDEAVADARPVQAAIVPPVAAPVAEAAAMAIPIVEEELVVGKQTVDRGGVRVYRRVIEVPVEESIQLAEEHVSVERHPVDRAVTDQDLRMQGERTIELTETAEEAVVGKSAHVVEEVHIGKVATDRTEQIHDTVRRTEVELEEIAPEITSQSARRDI